MMTTAVQDIRMISIRNLHESPLNTRQHFDAAKLSELATSMMTTGQLTPLLARPSKLPGKPGYELAAGHRRRRAAETAGIPELMVIVRDLDDRTFLEILTIDNLQREDVHPLEEAQGYRNLLTIDGYDPKEISDRVGKSESYVYDRLTLLKLIPELQELFFANRFTLGHAVLLARQGASVQQKLVEDASGAGGLWRRDHGHATLGLLNPEDEEGQFAGCRPVSVRELQQWIDTYVRFDAADDVAQQLFPETASTLVQADQQKEKVIEITREYHVHPDAKDADGSRTFGATSWKRADGQADALSRYGSDARKGSQTCEYSVIGLVAVGEGRGETFRVCTDKKRCMVHWGAEIKERNKRERQKENGVASPARTAKQEADSWEEKNRQREERVRRVKERWAKGGDAVLRAIAPQVKKLSVHAGRSAWKYFLEQIVEDGMYGIRDGGKEAAKLGLPCGPTPVDLIRHLIMIALINQGEPGGYDPKNEAELQADCKALGIKVDVVKLLDAANPQPAKTAATAKPKAKKAGRSK